MQKSNEATLVADSVPVKKTKKKTEAKKPAGLPSSKRPVLVSGVETNKQGQSLGRKGQLTRARLMAAVEKLLKTQSPVELTAVAIAKEANTSSATFYMYFDDILDILAALSEAAGNEMNDALNVLGETWPLDELESYAARLVTVYEKVWNNHREALRYRNMEADRGDPRFEKLRMDVYVPFVELMAQRIVALSPPDNPISRGDARALASVLHGALERMAMTDPQIVDRNHGTKRLKSAQARVIAHVMALAAQNPTPLDKY